MRFKCRMSVSLALGLGGLGSSQVAAQMPNPALPPSPPPPATVAALPPSPNMPARPKNYPGSWVNTNDYPSFAMRKDIEGTTGFALIVGAEGRVTSCEVTQSSGMQLLDELTCISIKRRARFNPATDENADPTDGRYQNRVQWRIPDGGLPNPIARPTPLTAKPQWITNNPFATKLVIPPRTGFEPVTTQRHYRLTVSPQGRVTACDVLGNSTTLDATRTDIARFDQQICAQYRANLFFTPATGLDGSPVASSYVAYIPAELRYTPAK